ncbi:hypothetical protein PFBG_01951 [Plasmodium falciparum 7G8]|uniref:Uncharacterized protein n=1 Tax=Plasmodium falciparum (isolate 7G8) TaxID=57266 RepID=W7FPT6_PLAF8|nr:hypothetical protein PFBG_01951 [Plasmodium falciparum 7G8]
MEGTSKTTSHKEVLPILEETYMTCTHNGTRKSRIDEHLLYEQIVVLSAWEEVLPLMCMQFWVLIFGYKGDQNMDHFVCIVSHGLYDGIVMKCV